VPHQDARIVAFVEHHPRYFPDPISAVGELIRVLGDVDPFLLIGRQGRWEEACAVVGPDFRPSRWVARRVLPAAGSASGYVAAGLAPALATYTAVLLADTATPSWHEAYPELPFVFAGSALASAAGVGLLAAPPEEDRPARRLAVAGGAVELAASQRIEHRLGLLSEPYRTGRAGKLLRTGRALTVAGVVGALVGRRSRVLSALSGAALLLASLATRFGIFEGGVASTKDPKYTVLPQRQRLQEKGPVVAGT
jgi:hypothetical protein